jgi:hypothetical protein
LRRSAGEKKSPLGKAGLNPIPWRVLEETGKLYAAKQHQSISAHRFFISFKQTSQARFGEIFPGEYATRFPERGKTNRRSTQ